MFINTLITIDKTKPNMMIVEGIMPFKTSGFKRIKKVMRKHTLHRSATREKNKTIGISNEG